MPGEPGDGVSGVSWQRGQRKSVLAPVTFRQPRPKIHVRILLTRMLLADGAVVCAAFLFVIPPQVVPWALILAFVKIILVRL